VHRIPLRALVLACVSLLVTAISGSAAIAGTATGALPLFGDAGMSPKFTTMGGATPLATDKTVPHWHSEFTDPTNGVTYGYNMVGSEDPRNADAGTTTVGVDIIPLNFSFAANGGYPLNGSNVVSAIVNSPVFKSFDYTSTKYTTDEHYLPAKGGTLSPGNSGVQYADAFMRSQFNKTGSSYHLVLDASVMAPVAISVPQNQGSAYQGTRGTIFGLMNVTWFSSTIQNLMGQLHLDPTRLPLFLTDNVMLYAGPQCCIIGYHGAAHSTGLGGGGTHGNGNQGVQTFSYAAYTQPGTFYPGPDGAYFLQDIHALSHEIAEWADDPFVNNIVNPWLTPTAPQYGCTAYLETGDPVVAIGFTLPRNTYFQNGAYAGDGYWHPEDEVLLPWFSREAPNHTSQPTQTSSTNIGRYSFMGDLNPFQGFRQPATGC